MYAVYIWTKAAAWPAGSSRRRLCNTLCIIRAAAAFRFIVVPFSLFRHDATPIGGLSIQVGPALSYPICIYIFPWCALVPTEEVHNDEGFTFLYTFRIKRSAIYKYIFNI